MKTQSIVLLLILGSPTSVFCLEPVALTNAVRSILPEVLGAEHGCYEFMGYAAESNGWTSDECSEILLCAQSMLKDSSDEFAACRRENAIGLLSDFGSTNALDGLTELIASENGTIRETAAHSFLVLTKAAPSAMQVIKEAMDRSSDGELSFSACVYRQIDSHLLYPDGDSTFRRNLLRLVLERVAVDNFSYRHLDEILCREVPKWQASPQRAENTAKMIREHPDDARLVSFFETVRTNALESARTALPPERADADSPATTNQMTRASAPPSDSAPWAGLLDDLPEKKPWTPPPGAEHPL